MNSIVFIALNIFMGVSIVSIILSFYFRGFVLLSLKNVLLYLVLLAISSVIIQYYLFHTLYVIARTALFFYPLFILLLCFSLHEVSKYLYPKIVALTFVTAFGINYFIHANLYKTATWFFDSHTLSILNWINENGVSRKGGKIKIDYSWPFYSAIDYYYFIAYNLYPNIEIVNDVNDRDNLNPDADYYIYLDKSLEIVGYDKNVQKIITVKKDTVLKYEEEGVYLFRIRK